MVALKDLWHILLCYRHKKMQFFHGNENLVQTKKYGCLFRSCLTSGIELTFFDTEKKVFYLTLPSGIIVKTDEYYMIFLEIFVYKLYALPPTIDEKYYVFDVGMNRGYTALCFASSPNCEKVFGFEIDDHTYRFALENFQMNPVLASKINPYSFGLSNEEKEIEIYYVEGEDGVSTMDLSFVDSYWSEDRKQKKQIKKESVKQASKVFGELFKGCNEKYLKILKIDCEGAEYAIFADLQKYELLDEFDVIIGECHYGMKELEKYLDRFTCISRLQESKDVQQFCFLNNKIMSGL